MFKHCKITECEIRKYIDEVTVQDVTHTLKKSKILFSDFLNLISPMAHNMINEIREKAKKVKNMYFGKTVRLYAPLYISSFCINECSYCGFRKGIKDTRKRLSFDEIIQEAKIIKNYNIDSLLLVSGEDPRAISIDFLEKIVCELKKYFSYIAIEIYPMNTKNYKRLFDAGVHGVTLYQETYNQDLYKKLHKSGPKSDYDKRLDFIENAAQSGMYNIGLGALLGLYDWRVEAVSMAAHGTWLKKKYWNTKVQFSFPRITPIKNSFDVPHTVSEIELEQMMLAFRLFFPESNLFLSTRENEQFRNKCAVTCASHLSAASKVIPGGYIKSNDDDLGQFSLNDTRSVQEINDCLKNQNIEVVYKDWDECF